MKDFVKFIQSFLKNDGLYVFSSLLVEKLVMLINTIFIVKMIPQDEFGRITLITSILAFMSPWSGFGSLQVLMKFGAGETNEEKRSQLSQKLFRYGIFYQAILCVLFIIIANFYSIKFDHLKWIILLFAIRFFGQIFQGHLTVDFRMNGENRKFAFLNIFINCVGLLLTFLLTTKYDGIGYMISLALAPFLSLLFYSKSLFKNSSQSLNDLNWKYMWKYGRMESLAYFASELLFSIDIALIAFFMTEKDIALYKVAIILPMNLLFIPTILFQTDFPRIIQHSEDKLFLKNYISNYYKLFIPVGLIIITGSFFLRDWIIKLFFNESYLVGSSLFFIATITVVSAMFFRVLFLNLFSAIGKYKWNVKISIFSIVCLVVFDLILIPIYKLEGAVLGFLITYLLSGLAAGFLFNKHYKSLQNG
jgi:O-antigen/teichoic acid export membrane protein